MKTLKSILVLLFIIEHVLSLVFILIMFFTGNNPIEGFSYIFHLEEPKIILIQIVSTLSLFFLLLNYKK